MPEQPTYLTTEAATIARRLGQALAGKLQELREFSDLMVEQLADPDAPAPSCDARQHEADRVMVRAVSPGHPGSDVERDTWALDPDATGHRAPFARGDLVIRSSGREGIHRIVDSTVDGDAPRHRSLRITVEPTDVVVDPDAF